MKKYINDLKRYRKYLIYATRASLKSDVEGSYLNWLWWILDPLMFMLVYSFISLVVFGKSEPFFPIFIFSGLNVWNFFNKTVVRCSRIVKSYKSVVSRVYLPKYILTIVCLLENLFKMGVAFLLVFIMMPFYHVPISLYILNFIPVVITLIVFTFGTACIVLHIGVYITDLSNVINIVFRFIFYLSGVFYSIPKRVSEPYAGILLHLNPIAFLINGVRDSLLYCKPIEYWWLLLYFILGCLLSYAGIKMIQKHESSYVKVI